MPWDMIIGFVSKYKLKNWIKKIKTRDFFPESSGHKHGCALYTAKYGSFPFFRGDNQLCWCVHLIVHPPLSFVMLFFMSGSLFLGSLLYLVCLFCAINTIVFMEVIKLVQWLSVIQTGRSFNLLCFGKEALFYVIVISEPWHDIFLYSGLRLMP